MPKLSKRQLLIITAVLVTLVITTALTIWVVGARQTKQSSEHTPFPAVLSAHQEALPELPEGLETLTVLILGYGGPGHQGGYLTDVLQLVHVNFTTAKISLISIPRDLFVTLPNGKQAKINAAFTLGDDPDKPVASGGVVAKQMASTVTGLSVDYFIAVDFVGFQRAIGESLGGIEVEVAETLNDPWYPIRGKELETCGMTADEVAAVSAQYSGFELEKKFPCRYEHVYFEPGTVTMHGTEALQFVRSRHGSAGGDFSRSQRQHAVLKGIKQKLFSLNALDDAPAFFGKVAPHITTDLELEAVRFLTPAILNGGTFTNQSVVLSTENVFMTGKSGSGQFILLPKAGADNWDSVHTYLTEHL